MSAPDSSRGGERMSYGVTCFKIFALNAALRTFF
jgi:hypothetical protein